MIVLATYFSVLLGFSMFSHGVELAERSRKYFCVIDCHISYAVERVWMSSIVGGETNPIVVRGKFVVVELRTWFDPGTISLQRGDAPLTPNGRMASVRDQDGHVVGPSAPAEEILAAQGIAFHAAPDRIAARAVLSFLAGFRSAGARGGCEALAELR